LADGVAEGLAIARKVIAAQHGKGRRARGLPARQSFGDDTDR
jgi:hypothetical protein